MRQLALGLLARHDRKGFFAPGAAGKIRERPDRRDRRAVPPQETEEDDRPDPVGPEEPQSCDSLVIGQAHT
jgi:hypothetical protein